MNNISGVGNSAFESTLFNVGAVILSPVVAVVATPLMLVAALYYAIDARRNSSQKDEQRKLLSGHAVKQYDLYDEVNITKDDLTWLKIEKLALEKEGFAIQRKNDSRGMIEAAKEMAICVIPIFGYLYVRSQMMQKLDVAINANMDTAEQLGEIQSKIKWTKWHIDLLEGRMQKGSFHYLMGVNLPDIMD